MTYRQFYLLVTIDGVVRSFDTIALTLNGALADIRESYFGDVQLIQWSVK